jgi:3-methyladenine DNA glycosylase AlkD
LFPEEIKLIMELTAGAFIKELQLLQSDDERSKIQRYFKNETNDSADQFIGVKMGQLFELAKIYHEMPIQEIEILLESNFHEARAGAVSIMDKASRQKNISDSRLSDFFNLYYRRHDRINDWDLVDLGCLNMTGRYLYKRSRTILFDWAISKNLWERRSAILSTTYFIRQNDLDDTYKIAELLINDPEDLVHKATGWMLRFAGDKDKPRLIAFLDQHAATLPRVLLRNAIEKFEKPEREYYLKLKQKK